jgi:hypothetical protein
VGGPKIMKNHKKSHFLQKITFFPKNRFFRGGGHKDTGDRKTAKNAIFEVFSERSIKKSMPKRTPILPTPKNMKIPPGTTP